MKHTLDDERTKVSLGRWAFDHRELLLLEQWNRGAEISAWNASIAFVISFRTKTRVGPSGTSIALA